MLHAACCMLQSPTCHCATAVPTAVAVAIHKYRPMRAGPPPVATPLVTRGFSTPSMRSMWPGYGGARAACAPSHPQHARALPPQHAQHARPPTAVCARHPTAARAARSPGSAGRGPSQQHDAIAAAAPPPAPPPWRCWPGPRCRGVRRAALCAGSRASARKEADPDFNTARSPRQPAWATRAAAAPGRRASS